MIESVSFEKTTFEKLPFKFEAGTPDYVATHGLAKAIDYVSALGMDNIAKHEQELTRYCMEQMRTIDGIRLFGEQEGIDGRIVVRTDIAIEGELAEEWPHAADLNDVNMIDPFHLEAYNKIAINYNRDVEIYPVLNALM